MSLALALDLALVLTHALALSLDVLLQVVLQDVWGGLPEPRAAPDHSVQDAQRNQPLAQADRTYK